MNLLQNPSQLKKINKLKKTRNKRIDLVIQNFNEMLQGENIEGRTKVSSPMGNLTNEVSTAQLSPKNRTPRRPVSLLKNQNL
jgi:hypothetical protein